MNTTYRVISFVLLLIGCVMAFLYFPGGTGIKGEYAYNDGTRLLVVQKSNYSTEPYTTCLFFKKNDGVWLKAQLDFEDTRWMGRCNFTESNLDRSINIIRNSNVYATLFTEKVTVNMGTKVVQMEPMDPNEWMQR